LHPNNRHRSSSSNHPAQPIGAFPKLHETRTLWQFWCCPYSNKRRGSRTGRGLSPPCLEGRRLAPEPVSEAFDRLLAEVRACTLCEPHREAGGALSLGVKSNILTANENEVQVHSRSGSSAASQLGSRPSFATRPLIKVNPVSKVGRTAAGR
jgi:hypothetical protein